MATNPLMPGHSQKSESNQSMLLLEFVQMDSCLNNE